MKRLLLSLALLTGLSASALAQSTAIPNGGFETWTGAGSAQKPQNWQTTDDLLAAAFPIPLVSNTVSRTTDARGGSAAVRLETKAVSLLGTPVVFPGMLILGNRIRVSTNPNDETDGAGLPFTARPQYLQCYYKLSGANLADDSASVGVFVTRYINGRSVILGSGIGYLTTAASSYTQLQVPLQYTSALVPDSIHIIAYSGGLDDANLTVGNTLTLDDITTVGTATPVREAQRSPELTAYPNPSPTGIFTLDARENLALLGAPFTVTDALGRTVLSQAGTSSAGSRRIDLSGQPAGMYMLRLSSPQGLVTRRLVVQ